MLLFLILIELLYLINESYKYSYIYYILMYFYINCNKASSVNKTNNDTTNNTTNNNTTNNTTSISNNTNSTTANDINISKIKHLDEMKNINEMDYTDEIKHTNEVDYTDKAKHAKIQKSNCGKWNSRAVTTTFKTNHPKILCNIPVILGEYILEIPLQHNLEFKEKVLKIRNIQNAVTISNYSILWESEANSNALLSNCHIFINGILTRNIEYSSYEDIDTNTSCIKTSIKELICQLPFQSVSCVQYPKNLDGNSGRKINLHLKKAIIEDINSTTNCPIKKLQSKIILKLQIDLSQDNSIYV
ncbi:hypothetical protein [Haloimpatiens lingqiaonensis]|uniref:DUF7852 domain-containing protein n=1 Tax=Haloimpatiens lingqiaonensis TaxID=1380675 RepID=UPI0010FEBB65|nr:hypothetical protein [Haloimpatiens lingqiaonensis]